MLYNNIYKKKRTDINSIYYVNSSGVKVSVFSNYQLIIEEIKSLGFEPSELTVKELKNKISQLLIDNYEKESFESENLKEAKQIKYRVLLHHLKELTYWLYDFDSKKMPSEVRLDFDLRN
jgi:hypothetical protein